jgi:hypothetical protein
MWIFLSEASFTTWIVEIFAPVPCAAPAQETSMGPSWPSVTPSRAARTCEPPCADAEAARRVVSAADFMV